jgi:hypothetical protein
VVSSIILRRSSLVPTFLADVASPLGVVPVAFYFTGASCPGPVFSLRRLTKARWTPLLVESLAPTRLCHSTLSPYFIELSSPEPAGTYRIVPSEIYFRWRTCINSDLVFLSLGAVLSRVNVASLPMLYRRPFLSVQSIACRFRVTQRCSIFFLLELLNPTRL